MRQTVIFCFLTTILFCSCENPSLFYRYDNDLSDYVSIDDIERLSNSVELDVSLTSKTYKSLNLTGTYNSTNGNIVDERGFLYSTDNSKPTLFDNRVVVEGTSNSWTENITMLLPDTKYYVCAYALSGKNAYPSYSDVYEFITDTLPNRAGLQITKLEFANLDYNVGYIDNWGTDLFYSDAMRYLGIRITYNSLSIYSKDVTLYVKIVEPDGNVSSGSNSPTGYSFKQTFATEDYYAENIEMIVGGWGNNNQSAYPAGTYKVEIWDNKGEFLFEKSVTIQN
jgi:hypothetical protein